MAGEMAPGNQAIRLEGLWIYPVKSCAGVAVPNAELDAQGGLKGDREWIVVNASGEMQWQGGTPRLALVQPVAGPDGLRLQASGMPSLAIDPQSAGGACAVKIWNESTGAFDTFPGLDVGRAAKAWLSEFLGLSLRLVRLGPEARRRQTLKPLHVLTVASWRRLNECLRSQGHPPAELLRFRPNLLLDSAAGTLAPFAEEDFSQIIWPGAPGSPRLKLTEACARCVMVNVDPGDASVAKEPLATVARLSRDRRPDDKVCFGVYGQGQNGGVLTRGDLGWADFRH